MGENRSRKVTGERRSGGKEAVISGARPVVETRLDF